MEEQWRLIPGFGCHYEASSLGKVRVKDRIISKTNRWGSVSKQFYHGKILKASSVDEYGHMSVRLGVDKKGYTMAVHRLVLMAFVGMPPCGYEACHLNGIASDNRIENLRWDTHYNNNQDRKKAGHYPVGEKHHMAKLTIDQATAIRNRSVTKRQAMKEYGISNSQHHRIMKGESWKHIGTERELLAKTLGKLREVT